MVHHRSGPVRNPEAREAILAATAALFTTDGYDRLTVEGIAAAAKVGKQTIYRWWPDRASLVADCLLEGRLYKRALAVPDTGNIRTDLITWITQIVTTLGAANHSSLLLSLIAAGATNESVGRRLHDSLVSDPALFGRLQVAAHAGQLPDTTPEAISEALIGVLVIRSVAHKELDTNIIERTVDLLLNTTSPAFSASQARP